MIRLVLFHERNLINLSQILNMKLYFNLEILHSFIMIPLPNGWRNPTWKIPFLSIFFLPFFMFAKVEIQDGLFTIFSWCVWTLWNYNIMFSTFLHVILIYPCFVPSYLGAWCDLSLLSYDFIDDIPCFFSPWWYRSRRASLVALGISLHVILACFMLASK